MVNIGYTAPFCNFFFSWLDNYWRPCLIFKDLKHFFFQNPVRSRNNGAYHLTFEAVSLRCKYLLKWKALPKNRLLAKAGNSRKRTERCAQDHQVRFHSIIDAFFRPLWFKLPDMKSLKTQLEIYVLNVGQLYPKTLSKFLESALQPTKFAI